MEFYTFQRQRIEYRTVRFTRKLQLRETRRACNVTKHNP